MSLKNDELRASLPTEENYRDMEMICNDLKPIMNIMNTLIAEKYLYASEIIPLSKLIYERFESYMRDENPWKEQHSNNTGKKLFCKATFLNPRYKHHIPTDELALLKLDLCSDAHLIQSQMVTDTNAKATSNERTESDSRNKLSVAKLLAGNRDNNEATDQTTALPIIDKVSIEFENYRSERVIDADADPLKWWRRKQTSYRILSNLAKKYLCCRGTCCVSKELFF